MDPGRLSEVRNFTSQVAVFLSKDDGIQKKKEKQQTVQSIKDKYQVGSTAPSASKPKSDISKAKPEKRWYAAGQIGKTAESIFEKIDRSAQESSRTPQSIRGRLRELKTVRENLEKVSEEALKSENWFMRFVIKNIGIFRSEAQSNVFNTIDQLKTKEKELTTQEKSLWNNSLGISYEEFTRTEDINSLSIDKRPDTQKIAREAYFRLVGDHTLESDQLEGSTFELSLQTIGEDVKAFSESFGKYYSKEGREALQSVADQLAFAESISRRLSIIGRTQQDTSVEREDQRLADIVYDVQSKIKSMKDGDEFILPGGYKAAMGHAVVYSIKNIDGKFSFTIHNTGDGSDRGLSLKGGVVGNLLTLVDKAADVIIKDINETDILNPSFLHDLLQQHTTQNSTSHDREHSMTAVFNIIDEAIGSKKGNKIETGVIHSLQKNGTCTHNSVTCWLGVALKGKEGSPDEDKMLFKDLESYMIGSGQRYLQSLQSLRDLQSTKGRRDYKVSILEAGGYTGVALITKLNDFWENLKENRLKGLNEQIAEANRKAKEADEAALLKDYDRLQGKVESIRKQKAELEAAQPEKVQSVFSSIVSRVGHSVMGPQSPLDKVSALFKTYNDKLEELKKQQMDPRKEAQLQEELKLLNQAAAGKKANVEALERRKTYLEKLLGVPKTSTAEVA